MKGLKQFWKKLKYWQKGIFLALFLSSGIFILLFLLYTGYDLTTMGRFVCADFGGGSRCGDGLVGSFIGYTIWTLIVLIWWSIFITLPLIMIGALIGLIIGKVKKK